MDKNGLLNGTSGIIPAAEMPVRGMKMKISSENNCLTVEFEKPTQWMQFSKADAVAWVKAMVPHINVLR